MIRNMIVYLDKKKVVSLDVGDYGIKMIRGDMLAHHIRIDEERTNYSTKLYASTKGLHEKAKQDARQKIIQSAIKHGNKVAF